MAGINCIDYSTLTVSSDPVGQSSASPTLPAGAKGAIITVEQDDVRWRADGTNPTATEGHRLNVGEDPLIFDSWSVPCKNWRQVLHAIRFIRIANDAKLKITWID